MKAYILAWRIALDIRIRVRLHFWTWAYRIWLGVHPAVKKLGNILVTGRTLWFLNPRGFVEIGKNVRINSGHRFNAIGADRPSVISVGPGATLCLSDRCAMSSATIVCVDRIDIGPDVLLGGGCMIIDSDFHSLNFEQRKLFPDPGVEHKPVRIEAGAFIGALSIILRGVTVGERSVVSAGSVVFRDIPADEVWAGNPARFIRKITQSTVV